MQIIELAANKTKKKTSTTRGKVHGYNSMQFSIDIRALCCFLMQYYFVFFL